MITVMKDDVLDGTPTAHVDITASGYIKIMEGDMLAFVLLDPATARSVANIIMGMTQELVEKEDAKRPVPKKRR